MLPDDVQTVFISSVSGLGIDELKDLIWTELNKETNKIVDIVHRPVDVVLTDDSDAEDEKEPDDEEMDWEEDEDEDLSKYKGIGWDDQE